LPPFDRAERIAQHFARTATEHAADPDSDDGRKPFAFDHTATSATIRAALRPSTY